MWFANHFPPSLQNLESVGGAPTARWEVPLKDGVHILEFEHGTATGRRVVKIDGKVVLNREWMFRLVGDEIITFGDTKFHIRVDPIPGLKYSYSLWVNGESYKNFIQSQNQVLETWCAQVGPDEYRIILEKSTQNVWVNGESIEPRFEFIDNGAEIVFALGDVPASIRTSSPGCKNASIIYTLYVNGVEITQQNLEDGVTE
ncbi:fas apoptotic inhibitory molecule 1 isoform X1 [Trichogramma pretiosum]|uniref:fas apoptotic inhibitory molecule 1 isoform X1 n=1 Tax=Trichogramma pretiosum TaxID=7493 RepID=UPI000C71AC21|nr:fas apoptotic inhibitory molecule 1 isoform X1 [Trichogramma pretiosum]